MKKHSMLPRNFYRRPAIRDLVPDLKLLLTVLTVGCETHIGHTCTAFIRIQYICLICLVGLVEKRRVISRLFWLQQPWSATGLGPPLRWLA